MDNEVAGNIGVIKYRKIR